MRAVVERRRAPHLGPDPMLPDLQLAWSPSGRLALLNDELLPALGLEAPAVRCSIEDMSYSPGRECVVTYAFRLDGEDVNRLAVATFAKDDRLAGLFARAHRGRPGAALLSDRRCLVELFPVDWRLPRLTLLTDPIRAASMLGRAARRHLPASRVTVLRYRPHQRCVLLYESDGAEAIAKAFVRADAAAASLEVIRSLQASSRALALTVPTPLTFNGARDTILMERLGGKSLKAVIGATSSEGTVAELVELSAGALVRLHGLRLPGGTERSFIGEVGDLRRRSARLSAVAPDLAVELDRVLPRLESLAPLLGWRGRSFVHGDFKPSQMLLRDGRLALVDFDRAARGDPALDVGNFMAQFRKETLYGTSAHLRGAPAQFLAAYESLSPRKPVARRARAYEALALARMALRSFRKFPHLYARSGPTSLAPLLLQEALRCLEVL